MLCSYRRVKVLKLYTYIYKKHYDNFLMAVYETYVLYLAYIVNILSILFCGKLNFITSFYMQL